MTKVCDLCSKYNKNRRGFKLPKRFLVLLCIAELEVQAKRKAIAVLQDEINRILNALENFATLPELMMKKDKTGIKNTSRTNFNN